MELLTVRNFLRAPGIDAPDARSGLTSIEFFCSPSPHVPLLPESQKKIQSCQSTNQISSLGLLDSIHEKR